MSLRGVCVAVVAFACLILGATEGHAAGLELGCEIVGLDAAGAWDKVPAALGSSFDAITGVLADQGIPPGEIARLTAEFASAVADVSVALAAFPAAVPVPLLAGAVEIPLPLVLIDGVRFSGGILNRAIVHGVAAAVGFSVPTPLFDETVDVGGESVRVAVDADLSAWSISVDAVKRLDLWLAALQLSAGVGTSAGELAVDVGRDAPAAWAVGIDEALAALHLDEVRWAAFTTHVGARLEVGFPVLRFFAEARLVLPLAQWVGWWGLEVARWSGRLGVVIRF